jgi:hypothetical protein
MNLIKVHIIGLQAAEALVEFVEDSFAGETTAVGFVTHDAVDLGSDDYSFAADVRFQEPPKHLFAGPA